MVYSGLVGLMGQRRRRWTNIKQTLLQHFVFFRISLSLQSDRYVRLHPANYRHVGLMTVQRWR